MFIFNSVNWGWGGGMVESGVHKSQASDLFLAEICKNLLFSVRDSLKNLFLFSIHKKS